MADRVRGATSGHPNRMGPERPMTDLLGELSQESIGLIREELRLIAVDVATQGGALEAARHASAGPESSA